VLLLPAALVCGVALGACSETGEPSAAPDAASSQAASSQAAVSRAVDAGKGTGETASRVRAIRVLHEWDAARERALTTGDRQAVRSLYVPGSGLAAQDLELLRRYERRGVRLTDVEQQTLEVDVRVAGKRVVQLAVTERLAHAQVDLGAARESQPERLPASAVVRRVLRFERDAGGAWRLSSASAG
jgi:hypothetical protein